MEEEEETSQARPGTDSEKGSLLNVSVEAHTLMSHRRGRSCIRGPHAGRSGARGSGVSYER